MTAAEVFDYANARAKSRWDHDIQVAYLNAYLSLFQPVYDPKKFPKVDQFLSGSKKTKVYSEKDWKALIAAVEGNWGKPLTEKEARKLRKDNLRRLKGKKHGIGRQ